jgi:catechol 2,3-dioxygenase-like lactoylglutathione lyase family enzyme
MTSRFDETFRFYRDALGCKVTWGKEGDPYASFKFADGGDVALFDKKQMSEAIGTNGLSAQRGGQDSFALVIMVDKFDETYKTLLKKGVRFINTPVDRPDWGIRVVHFRDPEGNLIELAAALPAKGAN